MNGIVEITSVKNGFIIRHMFSATANAGPVVYVAKSFDEVVGVLKDICEDTPSG